MSGKINRLVLLKYVILLCFCVTGCQKSRTVPVLWIENTSGCDVYYESFIGADSGKGVITSGGNDVLASIEFPGQVGYTLAVDDFVRGNEDSKVTIFKYDTKEGTYKKVREWKYSQRNEPGRQLFNESYILPWSDTPIQSRNNTYEYDYSFLIMPEDIAE